MALLIAAAIGSSAVAAPIPQDVAQALAIFRPEGPKGWSYTQSTTAAGRSLVERFDSSKPEFNRWTLVSEDGNIPTPKSQQLYREKFTGRSQNSGAPHINQQIDLPSIVLLVETPERTTYQGRLKATDAADRTGPFLKAIIVWHKTTATIESLAIENTAPFSPAFGVKIQEMRTVMIYDLPTQDHPTLLSRVTVRLRGSAFWIKSLDADMEVVYTEYSPPPVRRASASDQRP